nr:DUF1566 domain-containing protein [uncultured Holophaga sp.]
MSSRLFRRTMLTLGLVTFGAAGANAQHPVSPPGAQPGPNPVPDARYVIDGSEVRDKETGLVWQRCTYGRHWVKGKGSLGRAETLNWASALEAGRDGWRLPTKEELETLVNTAGGQELFNRKVFPDVGLDGTWWYWSSTPYPKDAAGAWGVHFKDGRSGYAFPHKRGAVRLVRSGK